MRDLLPFAFHFVTPNLILFLKPGTFQKQLILRIVQTNQMGYFVFWLLILHEIMFF